MFSRQFETWKVVFVWAQTSFKKFYRCIQSSLVILLPWAENSPLLSKFTNTRLKTPIKFVLRDFSPNKFFFPRLKFSGEHFLLLNYPPKIILKNRTGPISVFVQQRLTELGEFGHQDLRSVCGS